jgi:branched-chain amino acid transport system permease protein
MSAFIEIITSDYGIHLGILTCIYLILAQSLNLTFGLGRLFNLAHIASCAIGAYATALLSTEFNYNFFICLLASMVISGIFAVALGVISLRLKTDYFAIGTLAFSSVVGAVLINWREVTRGVLGIPGIPRPEISGIDFYQNINFLGLSLVLMLLVQVFFYFIQKGRFGRSLRALAEYEEAAMSLGRNTARIRNISFFISSVAAGMAGSLLAYYLNYIDPSSFSLTEMVFVLTIVIVGRPGSFWGMFAATLFLILLPESLRFLDISSSYLGQARQFLNAAILFLVVYWKRNSLFPEQRQV